MEKSCGCIVFNNNRVLIVRQVSGVYGFPKGHIENGETEEQCAIRETLEETGVSVNVLSQYRFCISYFVHENIPKDVIYFISFLNGSDDITIQTDELSDAFWIDVSSVRDYLTFDNLKDLWDKVYSKYLEVYNG